MQACTQYLSASCSDEIHQLVTPEKIGAKASLKKICFDLFHFMLILQQRFDSIRNAQLIQFKFKHFHTLACCLLSGTNSSLRLQNNTATYKTRLSFYTLHFSRKFEKYIIVGRKKSIIKIDQKMALIIIKQLLICLRIAN